MSRRNSYLIFIVILSVVSITFLGSGVKKLAQPDLFSPEPAFGQGIPQEYISQSVGRGDVWQQVYKQLPSLPKENQYINKETGKVAPENTLVSRLIRYHVYVKGRPVNYRLDWKLTLADYLGVNEVMEESRYPGHDTLRSNPIDGDRTAINRLNRAERDALVQTLVKIFNGSV